MDGVTHDVGKWDMMIAHPPCTHLAVSGARWFHAKREDGRQRLAIEFFCKLMCTDIPVVVVENPVGIMSGDYVRKWFPDLVDKYGLPYDVKQIVQPFQFGERARKTTCLYGHGWEPLVPTEIVDAGEVLGGGYSVGASANYARDENGKILAWNDPRTAKIRSKSFPGIAKAMAEQWGGDVRQGEQHEPEG